MGSAVKKIIDLGCEPQLPADDDDFGMAMSSPVQAAVDEAVSLIESLVANLRLPRRRAAVFLETKGR